jgi:rhodanese-related sulfurtransferase
MKKALTLSTLALLIALGGGMASAEAEDITAAEMEERIEAGTAPLILDVRTVDEFNAGHLPGSINIPHDELGDRLGELGIEMGDEIVVYCRSGRRAGVAEDLLGGAGHTNLRDLEGHWLDWSAAGRPSESNE